MTPDEIQALIEKADQCRPEDGWYERDHFDLPRADAEFAVACRPDAIIELCRLALLGLRVEGAPEAECYELGSDDDGRPMAKLLGLPTDLRRIPLYERLRIVVLP